jgi:hypothetical protein
MGLKDDIYKAFEKNLGKEYLDADAKGKEKVNDLANDLSIAIRDFLLAQTFKVDKLSMNYTSAGSPVTVPMIPGPAASAQIVPYLDFGVDVSGGVTSSPDGGLNGSNNSEVRIRSVDDIDGM